MTHRMTSLSRLPRMGRRYARVLATALVFAPVSLAQAQETVPQQDQGRAAPTALCPDIACLFKSGNAPRTEQAAQATPSAPTGNPPPETSLTETAPVVKAKPLRPTITIAADRTEAGRVKNLAALLPKQKIKIVTGAHEPADFTITTSLATQTGIEKARLFTEQMHIVAGSDIATIADLRDRIVSFGPDKSMSQAAARLAFAALGISVKETPLDVDNALDGVSTGDVAAVVVLAPQPVARLASLSGLHLVSWPAAGPVPSGAVSASIDGSAYPGLAKPGETIRALGVDAVLALSASGARKPAAKTFLTDLSQHSEALSRHGFDLIKADLGMRAARRVASADRR